MSATTSDARTTDLRLALITMILMFAGCDGAAVLDKPQHEAIDKCRAANLDTQISWMTVPDKIVRIECVKNIEAYRR